MFLKNFFTFLLIFLSVLLDYYTQKFRTFFSPGNISRHVIFYESHSLKHCYISRGKHSYFIISIYFIKLFCRNQNIKNSLKQLLIQNKFIVISNKNIFINLFINIFKSLRKIFIISYYFLNSLLIGIRIYFDNVEKNIIHLIIMIGIYNIKRKYSLFLCFSFDLILLIN